MANLKAIINKTIGTTLTTAYTNTSGADAALKAFNVTLNNDAPTDNPSGASDWSFLGGLGVMNGGTEAGGFGVPITIRLSADRVLLLWNQKTINNAASQMGADADGSILYTQIVEYQTNKYVAGPITLVSMPAAIFRNPTSSGTSIAANSMWNTGGGAGVSASFVQGVALTPTKVVLITALQGASNISYLINLNIVGNAVSQTIYSTSLNTVFSGAGNLMQLEIVPDNTNQVVVSSYVTGSTYSIQAYNVTGSATPTAAGTLFNTGVTCNASVFEHGLSLHRRSDNTYLFAGFTSGTTVAASILTYNSSTNAWTATAQTALTAAGAFASTLGIVCGCVSNGTDYNSFIFTRNSSGPGSVAVYAQTSGTTINTTGVATTVGATGGALNLRHGLNLGNQKFVLIGGCSLLAGYVAGSTTPTILPSSGLAVSTSQTIPTLFQFESRPVYVYYNSSTDHPIYQGRTGVTATSFGATSTTGNYVPWGIPTGKHYMYHDTAGCWIIGQGNRLYALDSNGVILNEVQASALSSGQHHIRVVSISPSNVIYFLTDTYGSVISTDQRWNAVTLPVYLYYSTTVNTAADLSTATYTNASFGSASRIAIDLFVYQVSGVDNLTMLYLNNNATSIDLYRATWTLVGSVPTGQATTSINAVSVSTTPYGRPSWTMIPVSSTQLITIGTNDATFNSNASIVTIAYSGNTTYAAPSFGSSTTVYTNNYNYSTVPYAPIVVRTQSGSHIVVHGSLGQSKNYIWAYINGTFVTSLAGTQINTTTNCLPVPVITKSIGAVVNNNATGTNVIPTVSVFFGSTTVPYTTYTGTSGIGWVQTYQNAAYSFILYGSGIDKKIGALGTTPVVYTMTINNGTDDFYITPASGSSLTSNNNRNSDVYYVPSGYSVKQKVNIAGFVDTMLEVLEQ